VEAVWPACGSQGVRCRALVGPSDVGEGAALDAVGRRSSLPVVCGQKEREERERGSWVKRCSFIPFASSVSSREERGIDSGEGERETE
jgi:hypothetical protein